MLKKINTGFANAKDFSYLWILLVLFSCSDERPSPERSALVQAPFVGTWKVVSAQEDGVTAAGWEGLNVAFEQLKKDSGSFFFPDTPVDSIWPPVGGWKYNDENAFTMRDSVGVYFSFNQQNQLVTMFQIPYVVDPPECEAPCSFDVAGNWRFIFDPIE
jgi:hypothetical protein